MQFIPERPGYEVLGWSTDRTGSTTYGSDNRTAAEQIAGTDATDPFNHIDPGVRTITGYGKDMFGDKEKNPNLNLIDGTAHYYWAKGDADVVMPAGPVVVYAVYYALDDYATYTVDHWRIDGNGELIERVTETVNCITDEVVYAIDRLGDQVKIDNYTAMKKPFTKDDKFIGYTIADDAATVTYKPNLWTTLDHNVRSGRGKADSSLTLSLFYTADPIKIYFDLGTYGEMTLMDGTKITGDSYYIEAFAGQRVQLTPYSMVDRTGYAHMGWTLDKVIDGVTVADAKGTAADDIYAALMMNGGYIANTGFWTASNTDVTLHAVWTPNVVRVMYNIGGTGDVINNGAPPSDMGFVDDEVTPPGTTLLERPGYKLRGWYYTYEVMVDGVPVNVGTSEGTLSVRAADVAAADTVKYVDDIINGNHFTRCNGTLCDPYVIPAGAPRIITLYAVWQADNTTEYTVEYYKVDGNGLLQDVVSLKAHGVTGESVTIVDPNSASYNPSVYAGRLEPWKSAFEGYEAQYTTPVTYDIDGRAGMTPIPVSGASISAASSFADFYGPFAFSYSILSAPTGVITADGNLKLTLFYSAKPSQILLDLGDGSNTTGTWATGAQVAYDHFTNPGVSDGVKVYLPGADELVREGYEFKGWSTNMAALRDTANGNVLLTGKASVDAAATWTGLTSSTDKVPDYIAPGGNFIMPGHGVTLYAIWEAKEVEYQVVRYVIDGNGNRTVHDVTIHTGWTDEIAVAEDGDETDVFTYTNTDNKPIDGYRYFLAADGGVYYPLPNGSNVTWLDDGGNTVQSTANGAILGHGGLDVADADGIWSVVDGQILTLTLYYVPRAYILNLDLGAGTWQDAGGNDTSATDPSGTYLTGTIIDLPYDQSYGGTVSMIADGIPYALQGWAYDDGRTEPFTLTLSDGSQANLTLSQLLDRAKTASKLDNFVYLKAIEDAGLLIKSDATHMTGQFTMPGHDTTLVAVWSLSVQKLTFDPSGYADINDPSFVILDPNDPSKTLTSLYHMYYNSDGTVDETQDDSAKALGEWNTTDKQAPAGFEDEKQHNIAELVTLPSPDMVYRTGYMLIGWSTKFDATQPDPGLAYIDEDGDGIPEKAPTNWTMPAEETTLHAVWSPKRVELIYEPDDAERLVIPPAPTLGYTDCVASITEEIPVRPGYTFVGWANASGSEKPDYVAKDSYELDPPIVTQIPSGSGDGSMVNKETNPNVVYGVWKPNKVTLEYWGMTDIGEANGEWEVLLRSFDVDLTDMFDDAFDQNRDLDDSGAYYTDNDYMAYFVTGWMDEYGMDYITSSWTIQDIADWIGWDGVSHIKVVAQYDVRMIEVTYEASGYEDEHLFSTVVMISWFDSPIDEQMAWKGYEYLLGYDEYGDPLDSSYSCGDILQDLLWDPLANTLYIQLSFEPYLYTITFDYGDNGVTEDLNINYIDQIAFPDESIGGPGFNNPGYTFAGWMLPDGTQINNYTQYSEIVADDSQRALTLFAIWTPDTGTSSSPAEGADDIANSTGGNGNGTIMGPAGSDDVTDELPGNVSLVVDDVLSSVRLPQLVGTSTIGIVEASRALMGAEAMVATYAAPAVAVYEVAGEPQSSRTGAGNVTTVSRTVTNNNYGTNATQASVLSAIIDSILTEASQVRIATPVADQISASVHAANAGVASLTGTVCSGSSVPAFPTSIATSMAPVAVVPATTRREA